MSTRKADDLVRALGLEGVGRSEVPRICEEPDEAMERRGLRGVQLVISDAHGGLRRAISEVLAGVSW